MNIDHITDITIHFNDPEWILEHITIGLQASSDGDIIKSPCDLDGIEQYLFLKGKLSDTSYSVKITPAILSHVGIDESRAWEKQWRIFAQIRRSQALQSFCRTCREFH